MQLKGVGIFCLIAVYSLAGVTGWSLAQSGGYNDLSDYTPPPMFGPSSTPPESSPEKTEGTPKTDKTPLPLRKPGVRPVLASEHTLTETAESMPAVPTTAIISEALPDSQAAIQEERRETDPPPTVSDVSVDQSHTASDKPLDQELTAKSVQISKEPVAFSRLLFTAGETEVNALNAQLLDGMIVPELNRNSAVRLQIIAFAGSNPESGSSSARRLSLARALAVREKLLSLGISAERIDVRALGSQTNESPVDRVDLLLINPI